MKIEILGPGCSRCNMLAENARAAVELAGLTECSIEKVKDFDEVAKRGVLVTPALVVDGDVKVVGKVLSPNEIAGYLRSR